METLEKVQQESLEKIENSILPAVPERFFVGTEMFRLGYKGENSITKVPEEIMLNVIWKGDRYVNETGTYQYYIFKKDEFIEKLNSIGYRSTKLSEYLENHKQLTTLKIKTLIKERKLKNLLLKHIDDLIVVRYDMIDFPEQNKTVFLFRPPKEKSYKKLPSLAERALTEGERLIKELKQKEVERQSPETVEKEEIKQNSNTNADKLYIKYTENYIVISGKTYKYKDLLKKAGFSWHPEKKIWYAKRENINFEDETYKEIEKMTTILE